MFDAKMLENIIGRVVVQFKKTEEKNIVIGMLLIIFAKTNEMGKYFTEEQKLYVFQHMK